MIDVLDLARANAALIAILAPLCGAGLALLIPSGRWACAPAVLALAVSSIAAGDLAWRMLLLGQAPPMAMNGLVLRLDGVGVAAAALSSVTAALIALASPALIGPGRRAPLAACLLQLAAAGWIASAFASDLVMLFAAIEIGMLASCALGALGGGRDRGALGGALRFLINNGVAGALMLIGVAFVARASGVATFDALGDAPAPAPHAAAIGFGLVISALAMKAGVAPLHGWAGAYYGRGGALGVLAFAALGAPALLAALARVAAYAVATPPIGEHIAPALLALGLVSVVIGSVQAIGARNLARLAAYANAAQAGCFLIAIAMGSPAGFAAGLVQILALAAASLALLGGAAATAHPAHLEALDGLARRAPFSSIAITGGALSLMGAPLTIGFLARWRLIEAGVGGGWWWAAGAVIVTSLAGVFYGGRLIERLYFRHASTAAAEARRDRRRGFLAPALCAALAAMLIGVDPAWLLRMLEGAGRLLAGFGP
ncbi:MAG: proton-conducting transporter membrane subunit [Hyphomonadaceae bacterium]